LVVDTREGHRRRECRKCRLRWNTSETLAPGAIRPVRQIVKKQKTEPGDWLARIQEKLNA
jgi:transcriptional regulator NrdR family protein